MVSIQEVAEEIYHFETTIPGINSLFSTYLIRSYKSVLVEPGPGTNVPNILEAIERLGMQPPSYIMPTHIHLDHGGSVGKLAELFPEAQVIVHPHGAKHVIDPSRLINGTKEAFGADFEKLYGPILPVSESQVFVPADEETIDIGDRELTVVYAPGHTPNHIAIFDKKTSGLFCGEALGTPIQAAPYCPLPAVAPPSFNMEEYLDTMKKLLAMKPRILFYSHDGIGKEPDKLIHCAIDNTQVIGKIILKSLKKGERRNQIGYRIEEYVTNRLGYKVELGEMDMLIGGYVLYYSNKYGIPVTN